jgi:hypothetical protein
LEQIDSGTRTVKSRAGSSAPAGFAEDAAVPVVKFQLSKSFEVELLKGTRVGVRTGSSIEYIPCKVAEGEVGVNNSASALSLCRQSSFLS